MTLKNSELTNFLSRRVGIILIYFLVSSAFCQCTLYQTNVEKTHIRSDYNFSSPEEDDFVEEEQSVFLILGNRQTNNYQARFQSKFIPRWVQFLWMSWKKYALVVLLYSFIGFFIGNRLVFQHKVFEPNQRDPNVCERRCIRSWLFLPYLRQLWKFEVEKGLHVKQQLNNSSLVPDSVEEIRVFQACTSGWRYSTKCCAIEHTHKCAFFLLVSVPCFVASANAISQETFCHLRHVSVHLFVSL